MIEIDVGDGDCDGDVGGECQLCRNYCNKNSGNWEKIHEIHSGISVIGSAVILVYCVLNLATCGRFDKHANVVYLFSTVFKLDFLPLRRS